jgi:phage-related protein
MRELLVYKSYFWDFYNEQTEEVKEKIDYVLDVVINHKRIPKQFFKHIEGTEGLYEIRIKLGTNIYRIFCCFDKGNLVILFNAFQKKDQKLPKDEIKRALKLMHEYEKK